MPTVPDVELVSSWEEVDEAALSVKNGLQKAQLAAGVRASLDKADDAVQVGQQRAATDWDTEEAGIDENGKIVIRPSMSDEAKYSLLSLLSNVAYATQNGAALLADLEDKLFPIRRLSSITADYEQDRPIYDTDDLDVIKTSDDLTVTANYSDGSSVVLDDDDYTLSGTLTVGVSTITVAYQGKTDTIEVVVTQGELPQGYTRIKYVERPSSADNSSGYNTTGFKLNGTDDAVIEMGVMLTAQPSSSSGGYFLCCRQNNESNTVGFGIYAEQNMGHIGAYDGASALLPPHDGAASVLGQKFDLVVTKTTETLTITDGTNTDTQSRTPRTMVSNLIVFAQYPYSGTTLSVYVVGRIYYLRIKEAGVEKVNFIPCIQNSDNKVGFWNTVAKEFKTSAVYVAGPEV